MKKTFIIILIVVSIVISIIFAKYIEYSKIKYETKKINKDFLAYQNSKVQINTIVSLMGKAIDLNKAHQVAQNDEQQFIENDTNSIKLFLEVQSSSHDKMVRISMEELILGEKAGATKVENAFGDCLFEITNIEYHKKTKQIKQIVFTEVLN